MSTDFHLTFEQKGDNLHVRAMGDFDSGSACALHSLLLAEYKGQGRVLIDTAGLCELAPQGCAAFRARMTNSAIPPRQLLFKGENGFKLAPEGSRVVLLPRKRGHACHCVTPCVECKCAQQGKQDTCHRPSTTGVAEH